MTQPSLPPLTVRDLEPLYEAFSEEDDEDGNPVFLYSSFGFITSDHRAYFGQSSLRKFDLTSDVIRDSLQALPDDDVYAMIPVGCTLFPGEINAHYHVKGPMLNTAFLGTGLLPKLTMQEVEVLELLRKRPHSNVIRYHGCLVDRGRVVGLVFDRLHSTLFQRLRDGPADFNVERCVQSVEHAVHHLHSLGLAHNDLNPANIMVDEDDSAFVIDFGSCRPFGQDLITAGSRGWIDEEYVISEQRHDLAALEKIKAWLESQTAAGLCACHDMSLQRPQCIAGPSSQPTQG